MPHLAVMRRGWQNEHLAAFLLSKLAFVAQPAKIGDDIGTDFFCTFIEVLSQEGNDFLVPKSSFAVQIKSSDTDVDATKQIEYLARLELPFFVGIVDQEQSIVTIYSGEYLPILFSHKGIPKTLVLSLEPTDNLDMDSYLVDKGDNSFVLKCPLATTLSTQMTSEAITEAGHQLREVASKTQRNITARTSNEYVFGIGKGGQSTVIMAGPGSVEVFRENFKRRLAEACRNLSWLADNHGYQFDAAEGRFYSKVYDDMFEHEGKQPQYLTKAAEELKGKMTT